MERSNDTMIEAREVHETTALTAQALCSLRLSTRSVPYTDVNAYRKRCVPVGFVIVALLGITTPAAAFRPLPLSARDQKALHDNFALCTSKLKGPYTENFCVCSDGKKIPVRGSSGSRHRVQEPALLRGLPSALGRGTCETARVHSQPFLTRPLSLGQLP